MCLDVAAGKLGVDRAYVSKWIADRCISFDELVDDRVPRKISSYTAQNVNEDVAALVTFYRLLSRLLKVMTADDGKES